MRRSHRSIQEIRQDLRNDIRHEMINLVNQSWEEDVLINDAFWEEFSLNNLLTFQATNSPPTVENENSAPSGNQFESINQHELPDQGANMSNFHYPSVSHFPQFLLPPENPLNEQSDASHIPIAPLTLLEEVVERNLSKVSRKGKLPMPHGKGSSKQVNHYDTISPIEANIDEVCRDFCTMGETVKEVVSTHPEEV